MNPNKEEVQAVVWPTEEPEIPPKTPAAARSAEVTENDVPAAVESLTPPVRARHHYPPGIHSGSTHALVWENSVAAAAVVRSVIHREGGGAQDGPLAGMSPRQELAALMAGLGAEVGGAVVRHLREADARWVASAVAEEPEVKHGVAMHALETLRQRIEAGDYLQDGGPALASALLERAFGRGRGQWLLRSEPGDTSSGFYLLRNVAPEQVAPFISYEHPQTIALVLSQIDPHQAAGILSQLPERMQADVAYRISTMENITPAVLLEIEQSLEASLADILGGIQDVGGPKVVADMLNLTGSSVEKNVLDQMDAQDPQVAEAVRNLMFVFGDIVKMTDRELQLLLGEVDHKDLVCSLKAAEEGLKDKLFGLVSEETRTRITTDMEELGPMRLSEVEEVQLRIVQQVRQLEEQGKVTIVRGDYDDDSFV